MTIRLLADREPYASYAREEDPDGSFFFCEDPSRPVDLVVMPAERLLAHPQADPARAPIFAYGTLRLMAPAFAAGCRDYLREPWSLTELRVRAGRMALTRFLARGRVFALRDRALSLDSDPIAYIDLSEVEHKLLRLLIANRGAVVTRRALALEIWGQDRGSSRAIDVHIGRLRSRLVALAPETGGCIVACRGLGYRLNADICG